MSYFVKNFNMPNLPVNRKANIVYVVYIITDIIASYSCYTTCSFYSSQLFASCGLLCFKNIDKMDVNQNIGLTITY